jgi:hypothetical protein
MTDIKIKPEKLKILNDLIADIESGKKSWRQKSYFTSFGENITACIAGWLSILRFLEEKDRRLMSTITSTEIYDHIVRKTSVYSYQIAREAQYAADYLDLPERWAFDNLFKSDLTLDQIKQNIKALDSTFETNNNAFNVLLRNWKLLKKSCSPR